MLEMPGGDGESSAVNLADTESETWIRSLRSEGVDRERAVSRLHGFLVRVAAHEASRRRPTIPEAVHAELSDLSVQAASDAIMAITRKLDTFRGEARFTTWASKFAILELSTGLRRRIWRSRAVVSDDSIAERLADGTPSALDAMEGRELVAALTRAIETELTAHQRLVFRSAALEDVPIDVLAERTGSSRGAIYKTLHDARRRLRTSLMDQGYREGRTR
jgi:RNA polymerase sigma-70 factor, ECF subfamily